jgi:hypothetical protein
MSRAARTRLFGAIIYIVYCCSIAGVFCLSAQLLPLDLSLGLLCGARLRQCC